MSIVHVLSCLLLYLDVSECNGHDSYEDANTCLKLMLKKVFQTAVQDAKKVNTFNLVQIKKIIRILSEEKLFILDPL